jgi:YHS domain-containing protein
MKIQLSLALLISTLILVSNACDGDKKAGAPKTEALSDSPAAMETKPSAAQSDPAPGKAPTSFDAVPPFGTQATCSVMGNVFAIKESSDHSEYKGKHYFFCCPGCKPKFDADPEKYIQ